MGSYERSYCRSDRRVGRPFVLRGIEGLRALEASSFTGIVRFDRADERTRSDASQGSSGGAVGNDDAIGDEREDDGDVPTTDAPVGGELGGNESGAPNDEDWSDDHRDGTGERAHPERPWLAMVDGTIRGAFDVEYVADGETQRGTEEFDVVFRDRMSEPLLVARLDETATPAPVERVTDLLTAANRVGETVENLAGALAVSGGYFEPDALRTAEEVTDGGFLSRDSRKSFVKRSRRRGYHLCLVEAMGERFHLSIPEL